MKVEARGYDPFWGPDMFRYVDPPKIVWEKPKKSIATPEDEAKFFGNSLKATMPAFIEPGQILNRKV